MQNNTLLRCTFTGIDEKASFEKIEALSFAFPFVEWGVLLSTSENSSFGRNRYPSIDWLKENLPRLKAMAKSTGASIALHVCGKETKKLLELADDSAALPLLQFVDRVQINFIYKDKQIEQLENLCSLYPHINFITQQNSANADLYEKVQAENHQLLFDQSGGRGIETTQWQIPLGNKVCGYAGGLGLDNVTEQLSNIKKVANRAFWIDMEGKIRTDDWLNLALCEDILKKVSVLS
jgi:hypothetical protein